jgi:hemoglobin
LSSRVSHSRCWPVRPRPKTNRCISGSAATTPFAAVSDEFIAQLTNDEQEKRFFIGFSTDSKLRIRQLLVDLVRKSSGGPCVYTGRDMKTAHAGAGITKADWDRSLKIFGEVLNKFKVPEKEQQELAALLLPLEKDVVDKQ